MQLGPGTRLAHYEISALLGKGGMGEVWRATDTRLGREVAIKSLPSEFTKDAERVARFEREARLLASLDHPGLASIHGIEEVEGSKFLVMQIAAGEDLAQRLQRGPIAVDEALQIARQIAEALEAAHEQGIVHRDLKPGNIKVDEEGRVRILDFGLAKAMGSEESSDDVSKSPTMVRAATHSGVILGTAGYMSPEQARGRKVDRRADIWAFGVVLWEMLTGVRLFAGETVSDTLAAVLRAEVDHSQLPPSTPREIRTLLRRCIERNPKTRLHDIADARIVLDEVIAGGGVEPGSEPGGTTRPAGRRRAFLQLAASIAVVAVAAGVAGWVMGRGESSVPEQQRFTIHLAPNQEVRAQVFTFSPDGGTLAFSGRVDGRSVLLRRSLAERETVAIAGTDFGVNPFFSPDGQWLGYNAGGVLWKMPVSGGRPFPLADMRGAGGATWLEDGTIVFAPAYSDGLFRLAEGGGTPERLTTPDRDGGELGHWWPDVLPGGRRVVFTAFRTPIDRSRVGVLDLETRQISWIVEGGFFARYVATGHIVYAKGQRLFALPFDPAIIAATGAATVVIDDVSVDHTDGSAAFAISSRGTIAYVTDSAGNPDRELVWLDREGNATPAVTGLRRYMSVSLSPDDRQAALTIQGEALDIWVLSFDRGTLSRLTSSGKTEYDAVWSRGGRELFYVVDTPPFRIFRIPLGDPDGGRPLFEETPEVDNYGVAVSPDGSTIAFIRSERDTGNDLFVQPIDGSAPAKAIRASRADEAGVSFAPDGTRVAYQSDETGRREIYVQLLSGDGERLQVTGEGGFSPRWARNGELFFRRGDELWVLTPKRGAPAEFDEPRLLFRFQMAPGVNEDLLSYDVTADGSRIIASRVPDALQPRQIEIVTGWTSALGGR